MSPILAHYARVFLPRERTDERRVLVMSGGVYWLLTGEYTTPGLGRTPAFIATDIRLLLDKNGVSEGMLENLDASFIEHLEQHAVANIAAMRRAA